ncbi:MAG: hypothetical protein ACK4YF_09720, partial [Exilispira sp.]
KRKILELLTKILIQDDKFVYKWIFSSLFLPHFRYDKYFNYKSFCLIKNISAALQQDSKSV